MSPQSSTPSSGRQFLKGDCYWIDFTPSRGSEQAGRRPGVIISTNVANRHMPVVTVASITGRDKSRFNLVLELPAGQPTPQKSWVLPFQIVSLDKSRLALADYIGSLTSSQLLLLDEKLRLAWGL